MASPEPKVVADECFPPHVWQSEQSEEAGGTASFCKRLLLIRLDFFEVETFTRQVCSSHDQICFGDLILIVKSEV